MPLVSPFVAQCRRFVYSVIFAGILQCTSEFYVSDGTFFFVARMYIAFYGTSTVYNACIKLTCILFLQLNLLIWCNIILAIHVYIRFMYFEEIPTDGFVAL